MSEMKTKKGRTYAEWVWIIASEMTRLDPQIRVKERRLSAPKLFRELGPEGSARMLSADFGVSRDEATVDITLAMREYLMHLPMPGAPQGLHATGGNVVEGCPVCNPDTPPRVPREMTWPDTG
jgi:hypothetical protein